MDGAPRRIRTPAVLVAETRAPPALPQWKDESPMRVLLAATTSLVVLAGASASLAQDKSWTGAYVGASIGLAHRNDNSGERIGFDKDLNGSFGDTVTTAAGADAFSPGFCGGKNITNAAAGGCRGDDTKDAEFALRAGYDYQFGPWVVGAVGEYSQAQFSDAVTAFSTTPAAYTFHRKLTDLWALRARGGYAFGDNLAYVTGGFAMGGVDHGFSTTNTANSFASSGGGDARGYQIGVGFERRVMPNVTVGVEYLRTDLDDKGSTVRAGNLGATPATNPFLLTSAQGTNFQRTDDQIKVDSFRITAAYRF
jgi:opacity protein-like surface antigen